MFRELCQQEFAHLEISMADESVLGVEVRAVLRGNNPGWVFADSNPSPTSSLVWAKGIEGFYLAGDPAHNQFVENLDRFVQDIIRPRAQQTGLAWFEVSGCSSDWDLPIERVFGPRSLSRSEQYIYRLMEPCETPLRSQSLVTRIDEHFLRRTDLSNLRFIQSKIDQFWDSTDAFLHRGVGFCGIVDEEITSICMSGFVAGNVHAIDIETIETHRQSGFGFKVGRAFIDYCKETGLVPHWDCMATNQASIALAEQLNLSRVGTYALYGFSLDG
jgi:RimJ/RimL family protein N-acetyltransferase